MKEESHCSKTTLCYSSSSTTTNNNDQWLDDTARRIQQDDHQDQDSMNESSLLHIRIANDLTSIVPEYIVSHRMNRIRPANESTSLEST